MRKLALLALTFGVVFGHGGGTSDLVFAQEPADPARIVRVRSESTDIAALIRRASETSATFRRLMTIIDGTDGLIYVDHGKCGQGVRACLVLHVQVAGPYRILHVRIEPRKLDCGLMASIGHELQHAIELLSDPHVTDAVSAYFFYDRTSPLASRSETGRFETEAAQRVGLEVRHEACGVEGR